MVCFLASFAITTVVVGFVMYAQGHRKSQVRESVRK